MMNCKNDDSSLLSTVLLDQWLVPLSSDSDRLTPIMKALQSSTTSEINRVTQCHLSKYLMLQRHHCENLKISQLKKVGTEEHKTAIKTLSVPSYNQTGHLSAVQGTLT